MRVKTIYYHEIKIDFHVNKIKQFDMDSSYWYHTTQKQWECEENLLRKKNKDYISSFTFSITAPSHTSHVE